MKNKIGISLIVLVITIIVMIILAATVVISLSNTGIINKAGDAVDKTNAKQVEQLVNVIWAEVYAEKFRGSDLEREVISRLENNGINIDEWGIVVTEKGVTIGNKVEAIFPIKWNSIEVQGNATINLGGIPYIKVSDKIPNEENFSTAMMIIDDIYIGGELQAKGGKIPYNILEKVGNAFWVGNEDTELCTLIIVTEIGENAEMGISFTETGVYAADYGSMGANVNVILTQERQKLDTPSITLENNLLTISSVENAIKYDIYINDVLLKTTNETNIDLSEELKGKNDYFISVCACGDDNYEKSNVDSIWISSIETVPGLYDKDNEILATWAELVLSYGLDINADYDNLEEESGHATNVTYSPYGVLQNPELSTGTKLIMGFGTEISGWAFEGCSMIESVEVSKSITEIASTALVGLDNLKELLVDSNNTTYYSVNNCIIETATKTLVSGCSTSIIPSNGEVITIGSFAFEKRNDLNSIVIPEGVETIEIYAFFAVDLVDVYLPKSLVKINGDAFLNSNKIKNVYYSGTESEWQKINGVLANDEIVSANKTYNYVAQ